MINAFDQISKLQKLYLGARHIVLDNCFGYIFILLKIMVGNFVFSDIIMQALKLFA